MTLAVAGALCLGFALGRASRKWQEPQSARASPNGAEAAEARSSAPLVYETCVVRRITSDGAWNTSWSSLFHIVITMRRQQISDIQWSMHWMGNPICFRCWPLWQGRSIFSKEPHGFRIWSLLLGAGLRWQSKLALFLTPFLIVSG